MFELTGAIAARNSLLLGELNQMSLIHALIGIVLMQATAVYTGEDVEIYYFTYAKFALAWMSIGLLFGVLTYPFDRTPSYPAARAWPGGPKLNPVFRLARDIGSIYFSMFYPLNEISLAVLSKATENWIFMGGMALMVLLSYINEVNPASPVKSKTQ
jgi:hypothetical protein